MIAKLNKYDERLFNIKCEIKKRKKNSHVEVSIEAWDFTHQRIIEKHLNLRQIAWAIREKWGEQNRHYKFSKRCDFSTEGSTYWSHCPKDFAEQIYNAAVEELNRSLPLITAELENQHLRVDRNSGFS